MNKQQLANKIWASANKMRSKIEANEYKDYILGLVFYKFLSDNEVSYLLNESGWTEEELPELKEDYENADCKEMIDYCKNNVGYFIAYPNLFSTWLQPNAPFSVADLSRALSDFDRLISPSYQSVYGGIFKTLQAGLSKLGENPTAQTRALKDLVKLIKDIPTDGREDYDVLGYVYEYLISKFASLVHKKAGEFYTPHEVAVLMSEIVAEHHKGKQQMEIYDPTSGSGSLLITIGKSVGRHIEDPHKVKYYAQELKENTYNLTRMNLVMRGIRPDNINTRCADSLDEDWPIQTTNGNLGKPLYVDAVVSNPPYSQHWDPTDAEHDARFKDYGTAPKSRADYAFLLHNLHHLKPDGILAIVLPHGALFRGNPDDGAEGQIRYNLIEKNQIDAVIGLPANIFFDTGIPTLIMVLKQHRDDDDVLIIDASKGFEKDGTHNRLRDRDIKRVADTVRDRLTIPGFSRTVSRDEIRANGYNLNIPRYVDSSEPTEHYDIHATIFGGIPESEVDELSRYWKALPSLRSELFARMDGKPYCTAAGDDLAGIIGRNADVKQLQASFDKAFSGFDDELHSRLITNLMHVKELVEQDAIADDIFHRMEPLPLVDKYAAYQVLSDRWQTIVGDVEVLQTEGLAAARVVETAYKVVKKDDEEVEVPNGLKGRIIPFDLVQQERFQAELTAIADKENRVEEIAESLTELQEGLSDDEQLSYLDDDKLNKKLIKADAKKKGDDIEPETREKLRQFVALWDEQTRVNREIKVERQALIDKTRQAIESLTDEEMEHFLHLKWIYPICQGIAELLPAELSALERAVSRLAKKYADSYVDINRQLAETQNELSGYIAQLDADAFSADAFNALINDLKEGALQAFFPQQGETQPKIRFKGCKGEWERKKLGDIARKVSEKNTQCEYKETFTNSAEMGIISQLDYFDHDITNKANISGYYVVQSDDFVYNPRISVTAPVGPISRNKLGRCGIMSPLYTVFHFEKVDNGFMEYYFKTIVWHSFMYQEGNTGARNDRFSIKDSVFFTMPILLPPSLPEQRLIANFFRTLDHRIESERQRLEKLKQLKAACLEKMFV